MKLNKVSLVFIALLLVGCTANANTVSNIAADTGTNETDQLTVLDEMIDDEMAEEELSKEEDEVNEETNDSFSSDSKSETHEPSKPSIEQPAPEKPKIEEKEPEKPSDPEPIIEAPAPVPETPKPDPKPEKPKEEPKKTFVLPANWTNGNEHNEYYLTTAEAAARVKALWDQRIDAGYSELHDAETNTTYAWVTWWK